MKYITTEVSLAAIGRANSRELSEEYRRKEIINVLVCNLHELPWTSLIFCSARDHCWAIDPFTSPCLQEWTRSQVSSEVVYRSFLKELRKARISKAELTDHFFEYQLFDGYGEKLHDEFGNHAATLTTGWFFTVGIPTSQVACAF